MKIFTFTICKRLSMAVLLVLVIPFVVNSEEENGKTCLWKIETESNTVYLAGSIHLLREDEYPLNDKIEQAFSEARHLVFETDIDSMESPAVQQYFLTKTQYPNPAEENLSTELTEETYTLVKTKLESMGLAMTNFHAFRPWFVSMTLTLRKMILLGFDPNFGVDKYFYRKAVAEGKSTSGLESPQFQVDLLTSLSEEGEEKFLIQTIEEYDSVSVMLDKMVGFWRSGDLEGLQSTMNRSIMNYPELHKKLLVDRNLAWMPRIEEILREDEDYMIIVGAGHLAGEQGLIRLLEKRGYNVVQP